MKLIQRFISSWLAVCLVLSMLPVQALATDKPEAEPMAAETAMTEPDAESIPTEPEISEPTEESVPEPKETDEPAVPMEEEILQTEAVETVTEEVTITETVSHEAYDAVASGSSGTASWTLDSDGTLTVSGSGSIGGIDLYDYRNQILKIVIEEGITQIGTEAFCGLNWVQELHIADSVTRIGESAFQDCSALKTIYFGTGLNYVDEDAFFRDSSIEHIYISDLAAWCKVSFLNLNASPFGSYSHPHTNETNIYINNQKVTDLVIPSGVKSIGQYCFSCAEIDSVTIPDSVTSLEKGSFQWSTASSITLGSGLKTIPEYAFCENNELKSITIKEGVTSIGKDAFYGCEVLEEINLPNTLKTIGEGAFSGAAAASITIPYSVTSISYRAFFYINELTTITFRGSKPTIGGEAFGAVNRLQKPTAYYPQGNSSWDGIEANNTLNWQSYVLCESGHQFVNDNVCTVCGIIGGTCGQELTWSFEEKTGVLAISGIGAMTNYTIGSPAPWEKYASNVTALVVGDQVTTIGDRAFRNFQNCTSVTLPETLTYLGEGSFYGMAMSSIIIPSGITAIGAGTFSGCDALTELHIPEGVNTIDFNGISYCEGLKELYLPASVKSFGGEATYGCYALQDVYYAGKEADWAKVSISNNNDPLNNASIHCYESSGTCGDDLTWTFYSDGLLKITGSGAMDNYDSGYESPFSDFQDRITRVDLPDGITTIGSYAFQGGYSNLAYVEVPTTVTHIRKCAFGVGYDNIKLKYSGTMDQWDSIYIADWTYDVQYGAECSDGTILYKGVCGSDARFRVMGDGTLKITGTGAMSFYKYLNYESYWSGDDQIRTVEIEEGITSIAGYAFKNCTNLQSISMPSSLKSIGSDAFLNCTALTEVIIPEGVTSISDGAFEECSNLKKITVPSTVTYIGREAFKNCSSLTSMQLPAGIKAIYESTFSGCKSLEEITIPSGVASISSMAFYNCDALTKVVLPEGVKSIGANAFNSCDKLAEVEFPTTLTTIDGYAFENCNSLSRIIFTGNCPTISNYAFADVSVTAQYPAGNATWTKDKRTNYGGTITWEAYGKPAGTCGDDLTWELEDGVLTISGSGDMYDYSWDNMPWLDYIEQIKEISLPDGLTHIGGYAFFNLNAVTDVDIPDSVQSFGQGAFCSTGIKTVTIPEGVTELPDSIFLTTPLQTITLPSTLEVIGANAFGGAVLTSIEIPKGVTTIGENAFSSNRFTTVTIPETVTNIGSVAFQSCTQLKEIIFEGNAPDIGTDAFLDVTVVAHYPADDETWTDDVRKNYGGTITWAEEGTCGSHAGYKALTANSSGILEIDGVALTLGNNDAIQSLPAGKYYLAENVDISRTIYISRGAVELCLNGNVLRYVGASNGTVFDVDGVALTIYDCGTLPHKFTPNASGRWVLDDANGTQSVTGGVITGGTGCIVNKSTYGGAVFLENAAVFNMYGGNLVGNTADWGGAIYNSRTYGDTSIEVINLYDCRIAGNITTRDDNGQGGGIYVESANLTMDNVRVDHNASYDGGGICSNYSADTYITNCILEDNESWGYGGGAIYNAGLLHLKDTTTTNNTASGYGGGIYAYQSSNSVSKVYLSGLVRIDGNTTSRTNGGNNLYMLTNYKNVTMTIEETLSEGSNVGIVMSKTNGVFTSGNAGAYAEYFHSDHADYHVQTSENELLWSSHTIVIDEAVAPDCVNTGLTEGKHCSVCSEVLVAQEVIPAKGHAKVSIIEQVDATCKADGVKTHYFCDVCDTYYETRSEEDEKILSDLIGNADDLATWKTTEGKINKLPHTNKIVPAEAPTCTSTGMMEHWKCEFCGNLYADENGTKEITDVTVDIDPDAHDWNNGENTDRPTCTKVGVKTFTCQHNASHIYTQNVEIDANAHTYGDLIPAKPEVHKKTELKPAVAAHYLCGCGAYFTENKVETTLEALTGETPKHSYTGVVTTDPTCTKTGEETFTCSCGDSYIEDVAIDTNAHDWDEGKVTTYPTCSAKGVKTFTCKHNANHIYTEDVAIAPDAHDYGDLIPVKAEVHTKDALEPSVDAHYFCGLCDTYFDENKAATTLENLTGETPKHTYTCTVTTIPTCTVEGEKTWTCACDDSYTEPMAINPDAHAWDEIVYDWTADGKACTAIRTCLYNDDHTKTAKAKVASKVKTEPGCTSLGETTYTASFVVDWAKTQTKDIFDIPVKGHDMKETIARVEPDCENPGQEAIFTCANGCGHTEGGKIIAALGHDYESMVTKPDCENGGHTTHTCAVCGDNYVDDEVGALGHTEVIDKAVTATCTATGLTEGKHCSVCKEVLVKQETIKELGHTEAIDKAVAATCTATGLTEGKHCSVCDEVLVKQETIKELGHTEVIDKAVAATCTATGLTEGKHCSVCNAILVAQETIVALGHKWTAADCDTPKTCSVCKATEGKALGHSYDDNVDGTCNSCGINRESVEIRQVTHMLRMYNPYTGEHFYTGSEVEKDNLVAAGWHYEGVGFTFPANTGAPVYRLYDPATGEHLYTMDEEEKAALMEEGWNYEGIAFNSAYDTEAVQHRLHNPYATVGAYHFTFSDEEKQNLINAGWEYQGIGWYSCWK